MLDSTRSATRSAVRTRARVASICAPIFASLAAGPALAAPEEISVFGSDIQASGTLGLAVHASYVPSGLRSAEYDGQRVSNRTSRVMPEIAYGLGRGWETALHFPLARSGGEFFRADGVKWRFKYVPEGSADTQGLFWGANVEWAWLSRRLAESPHGLEFKAIAGWRAGRWLLLGNANVRRAFGRDAAHTWSLEPSAKLAYEINDGLSIGIERYHDLDRVSRPRSTEHVHYLVTDFNVKGFAVNFGVGRGSGEGADRWVIKAIVAIPW